VPFAYCCRCSRPNTDQTPFCTGCGAAMNWGESTTVDEVPISCMHCEFSCPGASRFCGRCGLELRGTAQQPLPNFDDDGDDYFSDQTANMGSLAITNPDGTRGPTFPLPLTGSTTIGRTEGDFTFEEDRYMSPRHLYVEGRGVKLVATDLNTLNGTFRRVTGPMMVGPGMIILVGHQVLRVTRLDLGAPVIDGHQTILHGSEVRAAQWALEQITMAGKVRAVHPITPAGETIGRHDSDILYPKDTFMSGQHARFEATDSGLRIIDKASSNGTWTRIPGPIDIRHSDQLLVGKVRLTFFLPVTGSVTGS